MATTFLDSVMHDCDWDSHVVAILGRRKANGGFVYLVQWSIGESTWEDRDVLEDGGCCLMLEEYDREKAVAKEPKKLRHPGARTIRLKAIPAKYPVQRHPLVAAVAAKPPPPREVTWDEVFRSKGVKRKKPIKAKAFKEGMPAADEKKLSSAVERVKEAAGLVQLQKSMLANPFDVFPGLLGQVAQKFPNTHRIHIYNISRKDKMADFDSACRRMTPSLVFHGTPTAENMSSIIRSGLKVPGTGRSPISVRHGAVHGPGIYTSTRPYIPMGYSGGINAIFLCAGVEARVQVGDVHVYGSSSQVIPLAVVAFTRENVCNSDGSIKPEVEYFDSMPSVG